MRIYVDTEFIEDGRTIDLVSLAAVSEDGSVFYRQNGGATLSRANAWVQAHVLPLLLACPRNFRPEMHRSGACGNPDCVWLPRREIKRQFEEWVASLSRGGPTWVEPEFWADHADYDWVAICQLFGPMVELPPGWPMYCNDVEQLRRTLDLEYPDFERRNAHFALDDAWSVKERWEFLAHHLKTILSVYTVQGDLGARRKESRSVDQETSHVRGSKGTGNVQAERGQDQQRGGSRNLEPVEAQKE